MKSLNEIKKNIKTNKSSIFQKYKIHRLGFFGSYVRGEQNRDSDLDILVEYKEAPSLITLMELEGYLSTTLGVKVDLITSKGLKPPLKSFILEEVVYL